MIANKASTDYNMQQKNNSTYSSLDPAQKCHPALHWFKLYEDHTNECLYIKPYFSSF
jgi:hypothetical protein